MALHEEFEKVERIAHGDSLDAIAAAMPYLLQRREAARHYTERPHPELYKYLQSINKEIATILSIF